MSPAGEPGGGASRGCWLGGWPGSRRELRGRSRRRRSIRGPGRLEVRIFMSWPTCRWRAICRSPTLTLSRSSADHTSTYPAGCRSRRGSTSSASRTSGRRRRRSSIPGTSPTPSCMSDWARFAGRYFKTHGKYYYVQCFQFAQGSPDADLGAIVFDVTGLPDTSHIKEVARIRVTNAPGGFHNIYTYKHSDGRALLFTSTTAKPYAQIFDLDKLVAGASDQGLIGQVVNPDPRAQNEHTIVGSFHDFWVGYDPATHQDKFYGAGLGGYYVFDVTRPETPQPHHVGHRRTGRHARPYDHADARWSVCGDRNGIPVRAPSAVRPAAGADAQSPDHLRSRSVPGPPTGATCRTTMRCGGRWCSCRPTRTACRCST